MVSFKLSYKFHILSFIFGLGIYFIMKDSINNLILNILINERIICFTRNLYFDFMANVMLILIPVTFFHELIHGATYKLFGGKVRFGFKGIYAYTKEVSGIVLNRTEFLFVLLSPVTVISVISILISGEAGFILYMLNFLGSTGDIIMALYLIKSNKNSYVYDKSYGFDIAEL